MISLGIFGLNKMKPNLILIFLLCYTPLNNTSFTEFPYDAIACREKIANLITVNEILNWFNKEGYRTTKAVEKTKDNFTVKYSFIESNKAKNTTTLELQYDRKLVCKSIVLQMVINGSRRIMYNEEAKRIMKAFISYNTDFEYYIQ